MCITRVVSVIAMRIKTGSRSKQYLRDNASADEIPHDSIDIGGALLSGPSSEDYIFEQLALGSDTAGANAPTDYIDLRKYSKPSRHQRKRGTCAAFAAATIREIQEHIIGASAMPPQVLSPEFIYFHRKNKPAEGMFGRDVLMIMRDIGLVPEEMFPYDDVVEPMTEPGIEHYEAAASHRISNFARVTTCAGLKRAIREVGPCYLVLPLYASRPFFWRPQGKGNPCGHSVAVVGYNHDGFILKNSWGPTWNGDGCVIFPYAEWELHWECWAPLNRGIVTSSAVSLHVSLDDEISDGGVRVNKSRCMVM